MRAYDPDGSIRYVAARSAELVVATLDDPTVGQWSSAQAEPFDTAFSLLAPPDLAEIPVTQIADAPLVDLEFDLGLEAVIPTEQLNLQIERHREDLEFLVGEAPDLLAPEKEVKWTRWWMEEQLVAERLLVPGNDACLYESLTYSLVQDDQNDTLALAELIYKTDVQNVLDRAMATRPSEGFVDIQLPIPVPPPGGGIAAPTLSEAASNATRLAPKGTPARLGPGADYFATLAVAFNAWRAFESLGDAMGCAISGDCGLEFSDAAEIEEMQAPARFGQQRPDDGGFEDNELKCRGIKKNNDHLERFGPDDLRQIDNETEELFYEIVGELRTTGKGHPITTIPDGVKGGSIYEMKGRYGSTTPLSASYQLRLQIFIAAVTDLEFVLVTDRPLSRHLQDLINEHGGRVEPPMDWE